MKHYMLYIPGLGDGYDPFRQKALRLWSLFSVYTQLLPMNWYDGESYDKKYQRASETIARLAKAHDKVSLIGESAGGSMAINLFAAHPEVFSLITIAGVNASSTPVASRTLRRGPAFAVSRQYIAASLSSISPDRRRSVHTLSAWIDMVVQTRYSQIPGANNRHIPTVGHISTIALCLTILSGYIVFLAKKPTSV